MLPGVPEIVAFLSKDIDRTTNILKLRWLFLSNLFVDSDAKIKARA